MHALARWVGICSCIELFCTFFPIILLSCEQVHGLAVGFFACFQNFLSHCAYANLAVDFSYKFSELLVTLQAGKCSCTGLTCCFSKFLVTLQAGNFSCTGRFCSFSKFLDTKCASKWSCNGLLACFPTFIKLQVDILLDWTFLLLLRISCYNVCKWAYLDVVWIFCHIMSR